MTDESIELTIHADGRVELHVRGVEGPSCTQITEGVERALGGKVIDRDLTPEYYSGRQRNEKKQQKLGGG